LMSELTRLFRCKCLINEEIIFPSSACGFGVIPFPHIDSDAQIEPQSDDVWQLWWRELDCLASLPALEFSLEAYTILAGLRSPSQLEALLRQTSSGVLQSLLAVWTSLGIVPELQTSSSVWGDEQTVTMESVLQLDTAWAGRARRHLCKVLRVISAMFPHEEMVVQRTEQLMFCFEQTSLRSLWKELHVERAGQDGT
jgi:hypothetical protein